jgi:hypothetical protein
MGARNIAGDTDASPAACLSKRNRRKPLNNQTDTIRVLIIGGYGTFGSHLARRLADARRLELLIAGRSLDKASAFVEQLASTAARAARFDRDGDVVRQLQALEPRIVVDASGPFQAYGENRYRVAQAAVDAGAHYLDLADDRGFVIGIDALNDHAVRNRVFAISGASTSPALTSAIYRHLARHFDSVDTLRGGIAPSSRVRIGLNIFEAITSYAGKAISVRRDGQNASATAICDTQSFSISAPGALPLARRTFSLVDLPDLELAGDLAPAAANTWFGAAPAPAVYHGCLRVLARLVKLGLVRSLSPLAPLMHWVFTRYRFGEHRGGLFVEVSGTGKNGMPARCSWHLVAEGDDGPQIPVLAAEAIIRNCLANDFPIAGARPAHKELELAEFESLFSTLNIRWGERLRNQDLPLVARILGNRWSEMPDALRKLHDVSDDSAWHGEASVTRGTSLLSKVIAAVVGFPPAGGTVPVTVTLQRRGDSEIWRRDFSGHRFSSVITTTDRGRFAKLFRERFGPVSIGMALVIDGDTLQLVPMDWAMFGIPMPKRMLPRGRMCEFSDGGRFHFHVEIGLPVAGHVVTYTGWLVPASV